MNFLEGNLVIKNNIKSGKIIFNEVIENITFEKSTKDYNLIIPGFIDLHCHGGGGHDTMEGLDAIKGLSKFHLYNGTTSIFPTTVTSSLDKTFAALKGLNKYLNNNQNSTNIEGIHLEGPFINPNKLGAQPPLTQKPNFNFIDVLKKEAPIKIMTLAPEIDGGLQLIDTLIKNDIKPQIGHTLANFDLCNLAINKGVNSFTHLYNAMSGLDHRKPGAVAAAFTSLKYSEIICDLVHVNTDMIKLAYKNVKKLYAITDCISAAGMKDGIYNLGTNKVIKKGNIIKLNDNTFGGSVLTMLGAFKNLLSIGFSIAEAVKLTSTNAANYLNRNDLGNLDLGSSANFLVLDNNFNILKVFLNGKNIYETE